MKKQVMTVGRVYPVLGKEEYKKLIRDLSFQIMAREHLKILTGMVEKSTSLCFSDNPSIPKWNTIIDDSNHHQWDHRILPCP